MANKPPSGNPAAKLAALLESYGGSRHYDKETPVFRKQVEKYRQETAKAAKGTGPATPNHSRRAFEQRQQVEEKAHWVTIRGHHVNLAARGSGKRGS